MNKPANPGGGNSITAGRWRDAGHWSICRVCGWLHADVACCLLGYSSLTDRRTCLSTSCFSEKQ